MLDYIDPASLCMGNSHGASTFHDPLDLWSGSYFLHMSSVAFNVVLSPISSTILGSLRCKTEEILCQRCQKCLQ